MRHYLRAAEYAVRHARRLAGRVGADAPWADSLWLAADSYDLAGEHELAAQHLQEYAAGRSLDDARRARAHFRLGEVYRALEQFEEAAGSYETVIAESPRSLEGSRSLVPLARTYLDLGRRGEAEQLLREVIDGKRQLMPEAMEYQDALVALGTLYHEAGEHVPAIERLVEALQRLPDDPRRPEIMYRLADSHRRRAADLARRLDAPPSGAAFDRADLARQRESDLEQAGRLFAAVKSILGPLPPSQLDPLQRDMLRYAFLSEPDTAFELGRFEQAIDLYEQAVRRYGDQYASLSALIQIVNCCSRLGDEPRASAAHERALARLRQLPETAFDAPEALMDRQAWEQWLANQPLGAHRADATSAD
jgi:tetratricopeptide (TPR) repeat protein